MAMVVTVQGAAAYRERGGHRRIGYNARLVWAQDQGKSGMSLCQAGRRGGLVIVAVVGGGGEPWSVRGVSSLSVMESGMARATPFRGSGRL